MRGRAVEATLVAAYRDPSVTTEIYRLRDPGRAARRSHRATGPGSSSTCFITAGAVRIGPVESPIEVAAGEDWSWESTSPHSYSAIGDQVAEAVLVIRHPVGDAS